MSNGNHVTITGNLTRDPELRFTPSGQATTNFAVAVNRRWQSRQSQEWEEATSYFDVVCWGQLAENTAQSIGKGARVVVTGRLDQRSWENQEGERRSKIEITADEVAPSLRWATMTITKNERRGPEGGYGGPSANGGNSNGTGVGAGNGYAAPGSGAPAGAPNGGRPQSEPAAAYQYDEEPF